MQMNPYQGAYSNEAPLMQPNQEAKMYNNSENKMQEHFMPVAQDIRQSYNPNGQNQDFAADLNPLLTKERSKHIRSLIASILLWIGLITIIALYAAEIIQLQIGVFVGICVGIYVFYLLLALCCNPMLSYLGNIEHGLNFEEEYNKIRNIIGYFSFHAQCYHYQTRYHTRTTTDSNGNRHTETYTTNEKVVTHVATEQLHPRQCRDDSGNVQQINALTEIVFIRNKVNYRFNDEKSRWQFDQSWYGFMNRHRRDAHQDFTQNFIIPGLKARMTFYIGSQPSNYRCYLIICAIFGLLWPYSIYIEKKVTRYDLEYMKILTM